MELFTLFLLFSFFAGIMLRDSKPAVRTWLLLAVGVFMCLVYFVLERMI